MSTKGAAKPRGGGGGGTTKKNWVRVSCTLPETLTLFQTKICDFPLPISDLTGTYTIGVNIKREIVLSPNDEEVASSKKTSPIQDLYRVHKPYPISDQNGQN